LPAKYWRGKMTDEYDSWRRYEDAKAFKNKLAEIDRLKGRIEKLEAVLREIKALHHDGGIDDVEERDDRTYFMVCEALERLSAP
jgi:hypothetical protein